MKVGILGAGGAVGAGVLWLFESMSEMSLILGGRNLEKLHSISEEHRNVQVVYADFNDPISVEHFCGKCDLIINCAGPSAQMKGSVAAVCMKYNKTYVDVSGSGLLLEDLHRLEKEYGNGTCIISAGIYPGLTELFLDCVLHEYDSVSCVREFFRGNGELSLNAAYDIVSSLACGEGYGMACYRNGAVEKTAPMVQEAPKELENAENCAVMPVLSQEFVHVMNRYTPGEGSFFQVLPDQEAMLGFVMIKALEKYKTEEEKRASAQTVRKLFCRTDKAQKAEILVETSGWINGRRVQKRDLLTSDENWNKITGYIAGLTAVLYSRTGREQDGICFPAEVIDSTELLRWLEQRGIIRHDTSDGIGGVCYEKRRDREDGKRI